ncbi:S9 family peptidase [Microbacterium sp. cf332]|uniref:S9 family peptidase n=1 Tax=Microbacterium sp. cf332 TaxID=1761804 RepID=UPI00087EA078|nr:S9 family peptidase [Microbacterium sp. cf332]SDQ08056.1 Dipeptidyl aminopeptidase/acylaminoacyl peptidase [Microbacterium sp. cf332]
MRPDDIEALVSVGRPAIAGDGSFAVFATSRPDLRADRNVGQLWRIDLPAGDARRITRGVADSAPRLAPDDSRIAFLRADAGGRPQVHIIAAAGSEVVQVTDAPLGVTAFAWSPTGDHIGFTARVPEPGRYGSIDGIAPEAEPPRRITGIRWHANGLGYVADRPAHVFVVSVPDPGAEPAYDAAPSAGTPDAGSHRPVPEEARQLTSGPLSHVGVVFTRDGREILTTTDAIEPEHRDLRTPLLAVPVDGGGQRSMLPPSLSISDIAVAPDGTIALLASDPGATGIDFVAPGVALWILDGDAPRRLTDPETVDLGEVGSHVTAVGDDFLVQNRTRGEVHLLRVSRDGTSSRLRGGLEVVGHAADAAGERIVCAVATSRSAGEILLLDAAGVDARLLTSFGDAARRAGYVLPRELDVTAGDGYPVHGWVAVPAGEGPFPVVLQIHGGPYASYGVHLFDETQVLVEAGYAVVYCNPRGSAGYGRAHGRSIRGRMGTDDLVDVLAFLDGAIEADSRLDGSRVGIMGGSYGGYLTAWAIAHEHRFAAAIVERGFLDPETFQGTSDIGSFFGDEYVGTDAATIREQSPMAVVGEVRTPTLVMHSELDFRCPLEQATRYYTALRRNGVDAELLVFPGEDHELTRSGRPRHRVQRFEAVLEWWGRHLPV